MSTNFMLVGAAALALVAGNGAVQATELIDYLPDTYIGANDHGGVYDFNGTDSIGGTDYNIVGASGTRQVVNGNATDNVVVKIYTQYNGNDGALQLTNFGDLFINPTWNPNTATNCPTTTAGSDPCDNYATGTQWKFGITTTGISGAVTKNLSAGDTVSGTGSIDYITNTNQVQTSYVLNNACCYIWRDGEPVQVDTANSPTVLSTDVTWQYQAAPGVSDTDPNNPNGQYNVVTYTFNADAIDAQLAALNQAPIIGANGDYDFALSWAMTCANDIIQGQLDWAPPPSGSNTPVPEPSSMAILLAALAGMVGAARLRSRRIAS